MPLNIYSTAMKDCIFYDGQGLKDMVKTSHVQFPPCQKLFLASSWRQLEVAVRDSQLSHHQPVEARQDFVSPR